MQLDGQFESKLVVADKIVVDDKDLFAPAEFIQCLKLRQQLAGTLCSGLSSVNGDDVAEFALERTTARELHRHGGILVDFEQIKPWERRLADIGLVGDYVEALCGPTLQVGRNVVENLIGLADHDMIRQSKQEFRFAAGEGTADYRSLAQSPGPEKDFANVIFLDAHSADHDEVSPKNVLIQQVLEAAVDQS